MYELEGNSKEGEGNKWILELLILFIRNFISTAFIYNQTGSYREERIYFMRDLHFTTSLLGFILLFGAIFTAQCDTDTRSDRDEQFSEERVPQTDVDEEDRRYDGTGTQGTDTDQGFTGDFESDREQLVENIEELSDKLGEELSDSSDLSDEQVEQIENDRTELELTLRKIQTGTEDDWENVRDEAQQTYEQISSRYEQRSSTTMENN